MFINGDCNWVNLLNDAVLTYNNNVHSTVSMTPVDASNNPDKLNTLLNLPKQQPNLKTAIMSGMLINVIPFLKVTLLTGIENCLKLLKF